MPTGRHAAMRRRASPHRVSAESLLTERGAVRPGDRRDALAAARRGELQPDSRHRDILFAVSAASVDRPFARPGDFRRAAAQSAVRRAVARFLPRRPLTTLVTLAFVPLTAAPHLVVLAPSCAALSDALDSCRGATRRSSVGRAAPTTCRWSTTMACAACVFDFPTPTICRRERRRAHARRARRGSRCRASTRRFRAICCAVRGRSSAGATLACVDELYGSTAPALRRRTTLSRRSPPCRVERLSGVGVEPSSVCTARAAELRFTVATRRECAAADGLARGVLPAQSPDSAANGTLPPARLLRVNAAIDALGDGSACAARAEQRLPALIRSQRRAASAAVRTGRPILMPPTVSSCSVPADAPETVLRSRPPQSCLPADCRWRRRPIAARAPPQPTCPGGACGAATCVGGSAAGSDCEQRRRLSRRRVRSGPIRFPPAHDRRRPDRGGALRQRPLSGFARAARRDDAQCPEQSLRGLSRHG